jgi:hypothetical protein
MTATYAISFKAADRHGLDYVLLWQQVFFIFNPFAKKKGRGGGTV